MDTTITTHEVLYRLAHAGLEEALKVLCNDYKPLFLSASEPYRHRMETMETEDFIQEGWICVWSGKRRSRHLQNQYGLCLSS